MRICEASSFLVFLLACVLPFSTVAFSSTLLFRRSISTVGSFLFLHSSTPKIGSKMSATVATAAAASVVANVAGSSSTSQELTVADRKRAALFGMYVGDATAMPVHWMYNLYQLQTDYGRIEGYVKPKDRFEGSIMNLSNTGGGGRGSDQGDIIGSVINHGKKKYWGRGGNYHYHLGLEAGENTLEAQLTRLLAKGIIEGGDFDQAAWLQNYIRFMTTPGSHNDTYASTCHRMFFANHVRGKPPATCADNDGHNTDAIDALTNIVPVIIHHAESPRELRNQRIAETIAATRKSRVLQPYAENFADLLVAVLHGESLPNAVEKYGSKLVLENDDGLVRSIRAMVSSARSDPMVACYIDSAYPAMLFFAYKYASSFEAGILASANAGGENVARGSLLGALLGAAHGLQAFPSWSLELKNADAILAEIDSLVALRHPEAFRAEDAKNHDNH